VHRLHSLPGLEAWCDFVVRVSMGQIEYMRNLVRSESLAERSRGYAGLLASTSHRADVRLAFPPHATNMLFPDLVAVTS
jgi:hypothetical protein